MNVVVAVGIVLALWALQNLATHVMRRHLVPGPIWVTKTAKFFEITFKLAVAAAIVALMFIVLEPVHPLLFAVAAGAYLGVSLVYAWQMWRYKREVLAWANENLKDIPKDGSAGSGVVLITDTQTGETTLHTLPEHPKVAARRLKQERLDRAKKGDPPADE